MSNPVSAEKRPYRSFSGDKRPMPVGEILGLYKYKGDVYVPAKNIDYHAFHLQPHLFIVVRFLPNADGLTSNVIGESIDIDVLFDAFFQIKNPHLLNGAWSQSFCTDFPGSTSLWMMYVEPPQAPHLENGVLIAPSQMDVGEHIVEITITDKVSGYQTKKMCRYSVVGPVDSD